MKKVLFATAVGGLCAFGASTASAIETLILGYGDYHSGVGGAFLATPAIGSSLENAANNYAAVARSGSARGFETFCLEYNEHFNINGTYGFQVSDAAVQGGTLTSDLISVGTGYLYSLFARGELAAAVGGGAYSYTTAGSAANLQNTFWFLEGEKIGGINGTAISDPTIFDALLIAEFGSLAAAMATDAVINGVSVNAASYGVAVLNLGTAGDNWQNQDQLFYRGGGRQNVPDGGTALMLMGMALGGLSLLKRKLA